MINHIITSSIVIIFVLSLSIVFEKRISPCIKYALWLMVVVKLLLPIPDFESKYHILNFVEKPVGKEKLLEWSKDEGWNLNVIEDVEINPEFIEGNLNSDKTQQINFTESLTEGNNGFNEIQEVDSDGKIDVINEKTENNRWMESPETIDTPIIVNQYEKVADIFFIIYILGVLICGGIFLFGNIRFSKYLRQNGTYVKTYKHKIPMYKIENYYGACLYGGLKPTIIVGNNKELSIEQQHMILTHEYVHYLHGDHIWSLIRCICVALYWYHPLVWVAAYVSRRDSELACDEGTLKRLGKKQRIAYGQSLLEIAKRSAGFKDITRSAYFYSTAAAGGMDEMKKRITMIARGTKTSVIALIVAVVLSVGCLGCTLGNPVTETSVEEMDDSESLELNMVEKIEDQQAEVKLDTQTEENIENSENTDELVKKYPNLHTEPQEDKVCIKVQSSEVREQLDYYYIPEDEEQKELKELLEILEILEDEEKTQLLTAIKKGEIRQHREWYVIYNGKCYKGYEEDYISSLELEGENIGPSVYYKPQKEFSEKINSLLIQDLGYEYVEVDEETGTETVLVTDNEVNEVNDDKSNFVWPTASTTISTNFGTREHPITGEKKIIDYIGIAGNEGDSVYAVTDGTITDVGFNSKKGNYIVLTTKAGEVVTYGHLMGSKVPNGQEVKSGEIIGIMGKTGSATGVFLSISVEVNGEMVDPMTYFN